MDMTDSFKSLFSSKPTETTTKQTTPVLTENELRLPVGGLQHLSKLEEQHGLSSGTLLAVVQQESGGSKDRANAKSKAGAQGWFQFMPETAQELKVNPSDFYSASSGAAQYLARLKKQFDGDKDKMLAAYNWGPGNVSRKGLENMPSETRNYLTKVKENISKFGSVNSNLANDKKSKHMNDGLSNPKAGFPLFNMSPDFKKIFNAPDA